MTLSKKEQDKINLKKIQLTHDEAVNFGRKGGLASAQARRDRKTFKYYLDNKLDEVIEIETKNGTIKQTRKEFLMNSLVRKTIELINSNDMRNVDVKALEFIRDTIEEKPAEKIEGTIVNFMPKEVDLDKIKKWREEDR